ncbi:hypothetical protein DN824_12640 [Stutzerimonas nosocomialis]|uniref:Uncharacterized protein n=1 Tax=Stutzerimonas nosocomialis TaxID=1056496 RepID=A0A5R9QG05_9GAMM|nr:hypothetical protein [Stutzerimonas nosocomialis]TLX53111.1 hypothetical protein DN826_20185 [Stutzerimonas nosocomialis]TLX57069.1 hypothetical protein DN824_12640 [Stutzerimonas nosocomialis]TLX63970.1 hypothetical protein DN820_08110 [Stutzerimonas nosocomialis]
MDRATFHRQQAERATAEARRLLEQRDALGPRWLAWVATQLYAMGPPEFAAMVRRELQRLTGASE